MLPPSHRLPELGRLINEEQYFVLHAARQMGKTTAMRAFAEELRRAGVVSLVISLEMSRQTPEVEPAERLWLDIIAQSARRVLPEADRPPAVAPFLILAPGARLAGLLSEWAMQLRPRPLVVLFDEVDCIDGAAMVSFLSQLRAGFSDRPHAFPSAIALIGMRDLKDYLVQAKGGLPPNAGSPFNIKAQSLTLSSFTLDEVSELYAQHTAELGQAFHRGGGGPRLLLDGWTALSRERPRLSPDA